MAFTRRGPEAFVRQFGYGTSTSARNRRTLAACTAWLSGIRPWAATMSLAGYDAARGDHDAAGQHHRRMTRGDLAAAWAFSGLLAHWSRKHAKAAYVPSQCRKEPKRQYAYGHKPRLARTDSLRAWRALAGVVHHDPGIKLEHVSTHLNLKRSCIASKHLFALTKQLVAEG